MKFKEFQASKVRHENMVAIAEKLGFDTDDNRPVFVYSDDTYIAINEDGTYHLQLGRCEWLTSNLQELEARLYLWCLTECPDAMGLNNEIHAALCTVLDLISEDDAVQSILSGSWEPHGWNGLYDGF